MARSVDPDAFIDLGTSDAHGDDKWAVASVEVIHPALAEVREAYRNALSMYRNFELSPDEFVDALADMAVTDANGVSWTIGAKTGAWFSRTGDESWSLASASGFCSTPEHVPGPAVQPAGIVETTPESAFQSLESLELSDAPDDTHEGLNQASSVVLRPSEGDAADTGDDDEPFGLQQHSGYGSGL
jgi:hypothetical protein